MKIKEEELLVKEDYITSKSKIRYYIKKLFLSLSHS